MQPMMHELQLEGAGVAGGGSALSGSGGGGSAVAAGDAAAFACGAGIERLHCSECTPSAFCTRFSAAADPARARRPVLIDGLMEGWAALEHWQLPQLRADRGDCVVNVGDDGETGEELTLPLSSMLDRVAEEVASPGGGTVVRLHSLHTLVGVSTGR